MSKLETAIVATLFLLFASAWFIGDYYKKSKAKFVKSHPQMYLYEKIRGGNSAVPVLFIEKLKYKEKYLEYYRTLESGTEPYLDNNIPLKTMPVSLPYYVIEYTEDSLMAKIVSYYQFGRHFGGSYTEGWVYAKALHDDPPEYND